LIDRDDFGFLGDYRGSAKNNHSQTARKILRVKSTIHIFKIPSVLFSLRNST
jgi:hypothetical protein